MSCQQLSPEHLSAIVQALSEYKTTNWEVGLDVAMRELLYHNISGWNQTYPTKEPMDLVDWIPFYGYKPARSRSAIEVYKLASAYRYNSSQSDMWEGSNANRWTEHLMGRAIMSLPEYEAARWTV